MMGRLLYGYSSSICKDPAKETEPVPVLRILILELLLCNVQRSMNFSTHFLIGMVFVTTMVMLLVMVQCLNGIMRVTDMSSSQR